MVIVRYASHPVAGNAANDPLTLPAFDALAQHLLAFLHTLGQKRPPKAKGYTQFPRPPIDRGLSSASGIGDKKTEVARLQLRGWA